MLSRRIPYRSGFLYHVYNRGNRKKKIFYNEKDYEVFYGLLSKYEARNDLIICGFCLMPNHFHLILYLPEDGSIPKFMQGLGISYTIYVNRKYDLVGHVFQGRYQAKEVATVGSVDRLTNYIRENPVKDGLVKKPEYYRWLEIRSSALNQVKRKYGVAENPSTI